MTEPQTRDSRRFGTLVAAIATIACCDVAMGLTFQLMPQILEGRGTPAWIIGLNAAMGPLGILIAGPFLPGIISRFGSRRVVAVVIAVVIATLLAFKAFDVLWAWFIIRFVFGIAAGTLFTVSEAWVLSASETGNRGRVMGLYTSVLSITFAVGPVIIPFTGTAGWLPWLIGAGCVLVSVAPLAFVSVEEADFTQKQGGGFFNFVRRAPLLLFAVGAATIFDGVMLSFFVIYGMRSGIPQETANFILAAGIIGNVAMQIPFGYASDRWSRMGVITATAAVTVAMCLIMNLVVATWLIWPVVIITGSTAFAVYTISLTILGDSFRGPDLIAGSAAFSAMWGIGGLAGPPIAGVLVDLFGVSAVPLMLAVIYSVLLAGIWMARGNLVRAVAVG